MTNDLIAHVSTEDKTISSLSERLVCNRNYQKLLEETLHQVEVLQKKLLQLICGIKKKNALFDYWNQKENVENNKKEGNPVCKVTFQEPYFSIRHLEQKPKENRDAIERQQFAKTTKCHHVKSMKFNQKEKEALDRIVESNPHLRSVRPIEWEVIKHQSNDLANRSAFECSIQWNNHHDPKVNKGKWMEREIVVLESIVKEGNNDWFAIAKKLGTGRAPFDCLCVYQTRVAKACKQGGWSEEEDRELLHAVQTLGDSSWKVIADRVAGRSSMQCFYRYHRTLKAPAICTYWTHQDDRILNLAVLAYSQPDEDLPWEKISKHLKNKGAYQCGSRWRTLFHPLAKTTKKERWSPDEDERLLHALKMHGFSKWTAISKQIGNRDAIQCRTRVRTLLKNPERNRMIKNALQ